MQKGSSIAAYSVLYTYLLSYQVVSRMPDSLAVKRESGQTVYYVSCKAVQEIFGVLIGLSTAVTYCDSLLRIKLVS